MEPSEDEALGGAAGTAGNVPGILPGMAVGGLSVYEPSFPARVAAFLRFSPMIEAVQSARRRGWPEGGYDVVTLALAAIDLVVARQGFEEEATRGDVVSALTSLASLACPDRPAAEHGRGRVRRGLPAEPAGLPGQVPLRDQRLLQPRAWPLPP